VIVPDKQVKNIANHITKASSGKQKRTIGKREDATGPIHVSVLFMVIMPLPNILVYREFI
jgi:hypothetical protein